MIVSPSSDLQRPIKILGLLHRHNTTQRQNSTFKLVSELEMCFVVFCSHGGSVIIKSGLVAVTVGYPAADADVTVESPLDEDDATKQVVD